MLKRRGRKTAAMILAVLCVCGLVLSGCKKETGTLWVLTDTDCSKTVTTNGQLDLVIEAFQEKHKGVEVIVERLPLDEEARQIRMQQLRTEIMAGNGPDIFLLPTSMSNFITDDGEIFYLESLFPDVNQAMHNGLFMDIGKLYDRDTKLDKDSLLATVMDAGKVEDTRYVLPLRYDIPVIFLDVARLEEYRIDRSIYQQGIIDLMDDATAYGIDWLAAGTETIALYDYILNYFPEVIDYQNQEVLLTREELLAFLNSFCTAEAAADGIEAGEPHAYDLMLWDEEEMSTYWMLPDNSKGTAIGNMGDVINNVIVSQAKNLELEMLPMAATDGSVIADVTVFGAIGANCEDPELAYELLRPLLMEDAQWQNNRVRNITPLTYMSEGWPVRARGAGYQTYRNQFQYQYVDDLDGTRTPANEKKVINTVLKDSNVYDENIEQLFEIDKARFPISLEFEFGITIRWQYGVRDAAKDLSQLEPLVDDFVKKLQYHVAEG